MNDNEYIPEIICELLNKGSPLVLASIISLQGSSPRHNGSRMIISAQRNYGTIGGSLLEATAIKEAREILNNKQSKYLDFDLAGSGAYSPGMICGGKTRVLLDYIAVNQDNVKLFRSWNQSLTHDRDFYFVTQIKDTGKKIEIIGRSLLYRDGGVSEGSLLTVSDIGTLKADLHNISSTTIFDIDKNQIIVDPIRRLKKLFCFGAGHVAVPTAHIASLVGFQVTVLDDREEFANIERFPEAYKVYALPDFNQAFQGLEIDKDSFIVIVTRGHQYDRVVLEQALKTKAGYIGMISSRRKRDSIYTALLESGVTREDLDKVHSPIGIDIGGETPEEIAVSIVAELIRERTKTQA